MSTLDEALKLAKRTSPNKLFPLVEKHITEQNAYSVRDAIRRLDLIVSGGSSKWEGTIAVGYYKRDFYGEIRDEDLLAFIKHPPASSDALTYMRDNKIMPTPEIWKHVLGNWKKEKFAQLIDVEREDIANGSFDIENPLHVELEYTKYMNMQRSDLPHNYRDLTWKQFQKIPFAENDKVLLSPEIESSMNGIANEVSTLYDKILSSKNDHPLLVIANRTRGYDLAVRFIESRLKKAGIDVISERVSSSLMDGNEDYMPSLSSDTVRHIIDEQPDIIVVDGTLLPAEYRSDDNEPLTRFPAAYEGYLNFFYNFNDVSKLPVDDDMLDTQWKYDESPNHTYAIRFWSPTLTEKVVLSRRTLPVNHLKEGDRQLILASSTGYGEDYSNGELDDIWDEDKAHQKAPYMEIVPSFSRFGFTFRQHAKDITSFNDIIYREIQKKVDKLLG